MKKQICMCPHIFRLTKPDFHMKAGECPSSPLFSLLAPPQEEPKKNQVRTTKQNRRFPKIVLMLHNKN